MHHPTDRITHTTAFVAPVVEHWLEREIAQWVHPMKDRSDDPSHHERTLYLSATSRSKEHEEDNKKREENKDEVERGIHNLFSDALNIILLTMILTGKMHIKRTTPGKTIPLSYYSSENNTTCYGQIHAPNITVFKVN